jgi:hypothetical protein
MATYFRKLRVYTPADDDIPDRIKEKAIAADLEHYDMRDDAGFVADYLADEAKPFGVRNLKIKTYDIGGYCGTDGVGLSADVDSAAFIRTKFPATVGSVPLDAFLAIVATSLYMRPNTGRHPDTVAESEFDTDYDAMEEWTIEQADLTAAMEEVDTAWDSYVGDLTHKATKQLTDAYEYASSWEAAKSAAELNNFGWDEHGSLVSLDDCEEIDEPEPGDDSDPT